ncbi:DNA-binding MarR family transcriptional regulator [Paenibacillus shirakamiensis]|uniref:DNA-binding MarR family transcriptional regulator n=1 Tax=Paenibacillus shirakamiensis TaxID=1265935 RepID=A0ABS4JMS1_9BACL|nr:MarR family transcriptional regulator [Paenibacillus shirakamiensis]MBP2002420.1 DNA-binding MarR family transcriptional regulator [Paenibacillus shirakamiensis]
MGSSLDDSFGFYMGIAYRKLNQLFHQRMKSFDITPEQWVVLHRIWEQDGMIQKEIGEKSGKDKPTTTRILMMLEEKGLVHKVCGDQDRRSYTVHITAAGQQLMEQTQPLERQVLRDAVGNLDEAQIHQLRTMLQQIIEQTDHFLDQEDKNKDSEKHKHNQKERA